ncbi:E3 ubiquitin-protein ligase MARCHF7-like [Pygocentrus nattereri]|uniref:RING-type E3 ubiquitin transferase n=1 Tax=Pygocentrus nattereri TaxID=42514 RepID=A0A3B4D616_PYGNA|nr:E3 ubiquitin-protein ligase MARCHF7-like [Pygocentrus nattereri]
MLQSWERRAEGLSNAEHMRELRHRNDVQYQEQLRKREREREDAEMRRQTQRMITPPLTPPKFKTRSYDRPWASSKPASVKTSPTSVKHSRPDARHCPKRSSVERLPDLVSGARSRPAELKASKTSHRAPNNPSVRCKEQSSQCRQSTSATTKTNLCTMSPKHSPSTTRRTQNRRKNVLKSKLHMPATYAPQEIPQHDEQSTMDIQRVGFLPRGLTAPDQNHVNWTHFPSLWNYSRSPESEPTPELHNPFQSLLDISSITEDSLTTESSDSSSADSSIQELWSSTSSDSDSSSPNTGSTNVGPISGHLLLDLTSESDEGEDEGRFNSWHDLRSLSSPPTLQQMSSLPPQGSPRSSRYESTRQGYGAHRHTLELQGSRGSPFNRQDSFSDYSDYRLPALAVSPGRSPPAVLDEVGRTAITLPGATTSGREDEEEGAAGGITPPEGQSTSAEANQSRTTSLMDHLNLALMALHDLHLEVTHSHRDGSHNAGCSSNPESKRSSNPETLRRITERLLEEESDEEDEDVCRICQCKGTSPTNPLLSPCQCSGSLQYIHHDCLKRWIQTKIKSGAELSVVKTCELCKGSLTLDLDDFDVEEYYSQHRSTQLRQDTPQLLLLLLLQQRFSELLQLTQTGRTTISRSLESRARPPAHRAQVRR